jgi:hypothetical protein
MILADSIKFFTLNPVRFSKFECFIGNIPSSFSNCFSILNNELSLLVFDFQEGYNSFKHSFQIRSKYVPTITNLMICYLFAYIYLTFESFFKPVDQNKTSIYDAKSAHVIIFNPIFSWRKMFYADTSFAVKNTCQVIESFIRPHMVHLGNLLLKSTINSIKCHSERLNPEAPEKVMR